MRKAIKRAVLGATGVAASAAVAFVPAPAVAAPFADISNWTGRDNVPGQPMPGGNVYTVIDNGNTSGGTSNSVGGTLEERFTTEERPGTTAAEQQASFPFLSGPLASPLSFADDLQITGLITFNNTAATQDPAFLFGFYNPSLIDGTSDSQQAGRLGVTVGNPTAAGAFRVQAAANSASGTANGTTTTITVDDNGTATGGNNQVPNGTYEFNLMFDAATNVFRLELGTSANPTQYVQQTTLGAAFDSSTATFTHFGIIQLVSPTTTALAAEDETFPVTFTNFNYTGNAVVPEPATLGLFGIAAAGLLGGRRRRPD